MDYKPIFLAICGSKYDTHGKVYIFYVEYSGNGKLAQIFSSFTQHKAQLKLSF